MWMEGIKRKDLTPYGKISDNSMPRVKVAGRKIIATVNKGESRKKKRKGRTVGLRGKQESRT